jgi:hypothetical protein
VVAGGPEESVQQPVWDEDGTLYFISDRTNWWAVASGNDYDGCDPGKGRER